MSQHYLSIIKKKCSADLKQLITLLVSTKMEKNIYNKPGADCEAIASSDYSHGSVQVGRYYR